MKKLFLENKDFIPKPVGANVTYHKLEFSARDNPFSMILGGGIKYTNPGIARTIEHSHDFAEITLLLNGRVKHLVNGETHELSPGTLIFTKTMDSHCFEIFAGEACELINFCFDIELLKDFSLYMGNDYFLKRFTAPVVPPSFKLSVEETEKTAEKFFKINREQTGDLTMAKLQSKVLLADLFSSYFLQPENSLIQAGAPGWFMDLCDNMKKPENFRAGLKKMNSISGCTQEHLCKLFKKFQGKTPTEFINSLRCAHAAKLMADTDEKIYSIAIDLGFKSISHFYRIFKKFYGISPAKYRIVKRKSEIPVNPA
jgi:AraC family cel operon transcriptional repressor